MESRFSVVMASLAIVLLSWERAFSQPEPDPLTVHRMSTESGTGFEKAEMLVLGGGTTPEYGILDVTADLKYVDNGEDPGSAHFMIRSSEGLGGNPFAWPDETDHRQLGWFKNGDIEPNARSLPLINQPGTGETLKYDGGIGIDVGVCLCTGMASDEEDDYTPNGNVPAPAGRGYGIEGPNNGFSFISGVNHGEATFDFYLYNVVDYDFRDKVLSDNFWQSNDDPVVLEFEVEVKRPGYLLASFVFASDELPGWDPFTPLYNDSFGILIKPKAAPRSEFTNIAILRDPHPSQTELHFTITRLWQCESPFFKKNQVAPKPDPLWTPPAKHKWPDGTPYYDHEFGGFSMLMSRYTESRLEPGEYTVKFVMHDVDNSHVDGAVLIPHNGVRYKVFYLEADFNQSGTVDGDDFLIWQSGFGSGTTWAEGDADLDGDVDGDDFLIWQSQFGQDGPVDSKADFDFDGDVDGDDFLIWQQWFKTSSCASRFEGDADEDGDVDGDDFLAWQAAFGGGSGSGGKGGGEKPAGGGGASPAIATEEAVDGGCGFSSDFNADGVVDAADVAILLSQPGFDGEASPADNDVNADGRFDAADLLAWQNGEVLTHHDTSLTGQMIEAIFYYNQIFGVGTIPEWLLDSE